MSKQPIVEPISCLLVRQKGSLPTVDIRYGFLIELVMVTDCWEIRVPIATGAALEHDKEGRMIRMFFEGDKLKGSDKEDLDPILQDSTVLQAICESPRIGSTWIVHCGGMPKYLFTLCAALNTETQTIQTMSCRWDEVFPIARQRLETVKKESQINYKNHDLSQKQEKSQERNYCWGESYGHHILEDYQNQLRYLELDGWKRLEQAKHADHTVKLSNVCLEDY